MGAPALTTPAVQTAVKVVQAVANVPILGDVEMLRTADSPLLGAGGLEKICQILMRLLLPGPPQPQRNPQTLESFIREGLCSTSPIKMHFA